MKNRRRQYWIDGDVQGALVRRVITHWLLLFVISAMFLPLFRLLNGAQLNAPFVTLFTQAFVEIAPVFVLMLLLLPFFVWDTVKLSNRFAGPMYRIRKSLASLAAGESIQPIRLRKGDFWMEVAHDFNVVRERLRSLEAANEGRGEESSSRTALAASTNE